MKRLCFLVPGIDSAHGVVDDLRQAGFPDSDIAVVAKDHAGIGDMPDAGAIEESDFYPPGGHDQHRPEQGTAHLEEDTRHQQSQQRDQKAIPPEFPP